MRQPIPSVVRKALNKADGHTWPMYVARAVVMAMAHQEKMGIKTLDAARQSLLRVMERDLARHNRNVRRKNGRKVRAAMPIVKIDERKAHFAELKRKQEAKELEEREMAKCVTPSELLGFGA